MLKGPLAALLEWQAMAEGAYSPNTLRAQKADGAIFQAFCEARGEPYLPADPKTIRAFIEDGVKAGKKPATVKRYVATIARVHIAAGLLESVLERSGAVGIKEDGPGDLGAAGRRRIPWAGRRSRNLLRAPARGCAPIASARCSASPMKRSRDAGELVALEVRDIDFHPDGTGTGADPSGKDGCGRAGEGGVSLARDGEVAEDLARACEDRAKGRYFGG